MTNEGGEIRAPIILFHWGAESEVDEIGEVQELVSAYLSHKQIQPDILKVRVSEASDAVVMARLQDVLTRWSERHLLFISAHGGHDGLYFAQQGATKVTYQRLALLLSDTLTEEDALSIVFGSCGVMNSENGRIETQMPAGVASILGFVEQPRPCDVAALAAGITCADADLLADVSALINNRPPSSSSSMSERLESVVSRNMKKYPDLVRPGEVVTVNMAERDLKTKLWTRMSWRLEPPKSATSSAG